MSTWYSSVSNDLTTLPNCLTYYYSELDEARKEVRINGKVENASSRLPGIVEERFNQLQEIEAILNFLNIELRKIRSDKFRKYLENYNRALSSRDVEKYVDGESDVLDMEKIINECALLRNKWLGIIKALENKSFSINNIIKLRVAGLDDISI